MSQLRFRADVAGDTHERDADTHDRVAHHAVALSTRNRASASRPHRSLRRLEARDSTRDEAAFHQHTCLPTLVVTRDMAHSELKAYSSNEETEDSHEDEIKCVSTPSFAPDSAFAPDGESPRGLSRRTRLNAFQGHVSPRP